MLDNSVIQEQIHQRLVLFFVGLFFSSLTGFFAWKKGIFDSFSLSFSPKIKGAFVVKGFGVFIIAELIVIPALAVVIAYMWSGHVLTANNLSPSIKGWLHVAIILGGFLGVWGVYCELPSDVKRQLLNQTSLPWYHQLLTGVVAWFLSYPAIVAFGQLIALVVLVFSHQRALDQVAVKHFKGLLSHPLLFTVTAFEVICLVPFIEEFLFRGLLQNWLKLKMQARGAVFLTSLLFAIFHYANVQGITNIELLSSLFLLSCLLGFLYEKQRSLWASIGLHAFFNFMSILLILKESNFQV